MLHRKSYGKGRRTVVVVSKAPLPNFRPDLDDRREERQVWRSLASTSDGQPCPGTNRIV